MRMIMVRATPTNGAEMGVVFTVTMPGDVIRAPVNGTMRRWGRS